MDYTAYYSLPELSLPLGPNQSVKLRRSGPILLEVQFTYEPGYRERPASGDDPGDPGIEPFFDFKSIILPHALVLTSPDTSIRTVITAGYDLFEELTALQLAAIEAELVQRHHDSRLDAKIDEHIVARAMAALEDVQ